MKLKKLSLILSLVLFFAGNVQAQEDFGLDTEDEVITSKTMPTTNEEFAEDEIFAPTANPVSAEKSSDTEAEKASESTPVENVENIEIEVQEVEIPEPAENLSSLVKQLNLSDEQLDELKFLSDESRMRQEQLRKSVELLKTQAREIEEQNLREFEAILTSEQREIFEKIRTAESSKNEEE